MVNGSLIFLESSSEQVERRRDVTIQLLRLQSFIEETRCRRDQTHTENVIVPSPVTDRTVFLCGFCFPYVSFGVFGDDYTKKRLKTGRSESLVLLGILLS